MKNFYYIAALINPFLAFIASLSRNAPINMKWNMAIVFCVFFGLNFQPSLEGLDSSKHYELFLNYHENGIFMLISHFEGLITGLNDPELYVPLANYLISRVSDSLLALFGFHALVYSFFFVGSIRMLYNMLSGRPGGIASVLFLFFIFLFPINQINAVRWYTAMWVFVYCFLKYVNGNKKFLYFSFLAGLIHFSLYLPALLLLLAHFIGYKPYLLLTALALSFLIPSFNSSFIKANNNVVKIESFKNRATSYTNDNYIKRRQDHIQTLNWYVTFRYTMVHYFLIFLALLFVYKNFYRLRNFQNPVFMKLFSFVVIMAVFCKLFYEVPSLGNRMRYLLWISLASLLFYIHSLLGIKRTSPINFIGYGVILFYAIVDFRSYSFNVSANWLLGSPMFLPLAIQEVSLNQLVFFWE